MTDIQLWDDEEGREGLVPARVKAAVRGQTVRDLTDMIEYLKPYATGMMGEPSPKWAEVLLAYLRQRGLLVGAYSHQPVREPVVEVEVIESTAEDGRVLGRRVLDDLEEMEDRMRKEGKS
jgi:hypothetical protein